MTDPYKKKDGFKTTLVTKPDDNLKEFEEDVINMVRNMEFRKSRSCFQTIMNETVQTFKATDH